MVQSTTVWLLLCVPLFLASVVPAVGTDVQPSTCSGLLQRSSEPLPNSPSQKESLLQQNESSDEEDASSDEDALVDDELDLDEDEEDSLYGPNPAPCDLPTKAARKCCKVGRKLAGKFARCETRKKPERCKGRLVKSKLARRAKELCPQETASMLQDSTNNGDDSTDGEEELGLDGELDLDEEEDGEDSIYGFTTPAPCDLPTKAARKCCKVGRKLAGKFARCETRKKPERCKGRLVKSKLARRAKELCPQETASMLQDSTNNGDNGTDGEEDLGLDEELDLGGEEDADEEDSIYSFTTPAPCDLPTKAARKCCKVGRKLAGKFARCQTRKKPQRCMGRLVKSKLAKRAKELCPKEAALVFETSTPKESE